jgi:hypothetical protein
MAYFLSQQNYGVFPYPPGTLYGMRLSNDALDLSNDIIVEAGKCRDVLDSYNIALPSRMSKRFDSIWTAGNGGGGRDSNNITNGTFHMHAIANTTTGVADVIGSPSHDAASSVTITIASPGVVTWVDHGLVAGATLVFSTTGALPTGITAGTVYFVSPVSLTSDTFQISTTYNGASINTTGTQSGVHAGRGIPILPSGYTVWRRVGSIIRSASINRRFFHIDNKFVWDVPALDINNALPGTVARLDTVTIPYGIAVEALLNIVVADNANYINTYDAPVIAFAPSSTGSPLAVVGSNSSSVAGLSSAYTNNRAQISYRMLVSAGIRMSVRGYIDNCGRYY